MRKINFCCFKPSDFGILLQQPQDTNTEETQSTRTPNPIIIEGIPEILSPTAHCLNRNLRATRTVDMPLTIISKSQHVINIFTHGGLYASFSSPAPQVTVGEQATGLSSRKEDGNFLCGKQRTEGGALCEHHAKLAPPPRPLQDLRFSQVPRGHCSCWLGDHAWRNHCCIVVLLKLL